MTAVFLRLCAVFLMIVLGWTARKRLVIDSAATAKMARLLINFIYPALIFSTIVTNFTLSSLREKWLLPVGAFMIMATGFIIGWLCISLYGGRSSPQGRAFHFQSTINNYSFLVMPLAYFYWGEIGLAKVVLSTLGSEVAMWSLGVFSLNQTRLSLGSLRQLNSPPIIAIVVALAAVTVRDAIIPPLSSSISFIDGGQELLLSLWEALLEAFSMFGAATIPLAMIIAGSRIADLRPSQMFHWRQWGVAFVRLLLVPAIALFWIVWLPIPGNIAMILFLVAVMPSAVNTVAVSEIFKADVEFASASVMLTHICCLLTIPFWLSIVLDVV